MKYREFNNWVYRYYFETLIPNQVNSLTIPNNEYEELRNSTGLVMTNFPEISKNPWSGLLGNYSDGTPKYLGLLALQCHAAFMMHNDGLVSAANFRERFENLVGIDSDTKLTSLFGETYNSNLNVQEQLWDAALFFFKKKNIIIKIPDKKSYAGRNTQYPQSQCILNYEDLKEYYSFYDGIAEAFEVIHYEEFCTEYHNKLAALRYSFKRSNNSKIISKSEEEIKLKQIFDYYTSNEWLNINHKNLKKDLPVAQSYVLKVIKNSFTIYDDNYEEVTNILSLFKSKKILFFKEDLDYHQEYNFCQKVEAGSKYVIVLLNTLSNDQLKEKLESFSNAYQLHDSKNGITSYKVNLYHEVPYFLSPFIGQEFPIKLIGTKVSRKRQYLESNPPRISCKNNVNYALYLNSSRLPNDQPYEVGHYSIKVNGFSTYSFEIIDNPILLKKVDGPLSMLNFATMAFSPNTTEHMSGFFTNFNRYSARDNLSINRWIKANTKGKTKSNKILLKALSNNKYGQNN